MATAVKSKVSRTKQIIIKTEMPFTKMNYILMAAGIVIILLSFILMWEDHQVDGFISLFLAPYMMIFGYLELIFAIMYRRKQKPEENV